MSDHETLPDLLARHVPVPLDSQRVQCLGCLQDVDAVVSVFATYWGFVAHLVDVIDTEFLIVPRSDIVTEYGVQTHRTDPDLVEVCKDEDVARYRSGHVWGGKPVVSREIWSSPWSVIPLPEDGQ